MAQIIFLGGEETGNVDHVQWGRFRFDLRVPTACDDAHIIAKASKNRFFKVEGGGGKAQAEIVPDDPADDPPPAPIDTDAPHYLISTTVPADVAASLAAAPPELPEPVVKLDPLAKARAAKAAKRAAESAA